MSVINLVLVLLGIAIGSVVVWALGAGASMNLVIGLLLVIAGGIVGFVVEWLVDESIRKNRELQRLLSERQAPAAPVESRPASSDNGKVSQQYSNNLAEIRQQLEGLKEAHQPNDDYSPMFQQQSETLAEILCQLEALKKTLITDDRDDRQQRILNHSEMLPEVVHRLEELQEAQKANDRRTQIFHQHSETLAGISAQLNTLKVAQQSLSEHLLDNQNNGLRRDAQALARVLRQHKDELHRLGRQVSDKDTLIEALRHEYEDYQRAHPDDLTQIKGIGPTFQRKLRDIGFSSFSQLAAADPAYIRRRLDIRSWQRVDIESWIEQARDRTHPI